MKCLACLPFVHTAELTTAVATFVQNAPEKQRFKGRPHRTLSREKASKSCFQTKYDPSYDDVTTQNV